MKIIQSQDNLFVIESEKGRGQNYTVDLKANQNKGSCSCMHFKTRIQISWRQGKDVEPCKHILLALGFAVWNKVNA